MVEQGRIGFGHANLNVQAIVSSRPELGGHNNHRPYEEAVSDDIVYCRCLCCEHDISRVSTKPRKKLP